MKAGARWLTLALAGLVASGCAPKGDEASPEREAPAPVAAPDEAPVVPDPSDPREVARLHQAVLEASYETDTLLELLAALPRPTPTESSLVALVGGILDAARETPAGLESLGLRSGARVYASARPLDGRAAALRKRLGETVEASTAGDPRPTLMDWTMLEADARSLGLHIRASLPSAGNEALLATLGRVLATPRASEAVDAKLWTEACAALGGPELCGGWPQLLVWARPVSPELVRVDAVYWFYPAASSADEAAQVAAIEQAEGWPSNVYERLARVRRPFGEHAMEMQLYGTPMLALLEAEALADVVVELGAEDPDQALDAGRWGRYLDRERALGEILVGGGVLEGLRVDLDYGGESDALELELGWVPHFTRQELVAELFAPVEGTLGLPRLDSTCADALACGRIGGLASLTRFADLAQGPYADLTSVSRVLRQAGDRGSILVLLSAWPRLLGIAGAMASGGRGLLGSAQSELAAGSAGLGFVVEGLEADARHSRGFAYMRVEPAVLDALGPAATLAGLRLKAIELPGAERAERGRYEDFAVYMIDAEAPDEGAWIVVVDDCEGGCVPAAEQRIRALLSSERDAEGTLDPVAAFEVGALGPVVAYEALDPGDDPPVRAWLDRHRLELGFRFTPEGPRVELLVAPSETH